MIRISDGVPQHHDEDAIHKAVVNPVTDVTTLERNTVGAHLNLVTDRGNQFLILEGMKFTGKDLTHTTTQMLVQITFPYVYLHGSDGLLGYGAYIFKKDIGSNSMRVELLLRAGGLPYTPVIFHHDKLELTNIPIKNIKNHAHSALSGVKKLIELDIRGTPYYFEVYPTKA